MLFYKYIIMNYKVNSGKKKNVSLLVQSDNAQVCVHDNSFFVSTPLTVVCWTIACSRHYIYHNIRYILFRYHATLRNPSVMTCLLGTSCCCMMSIEWGYVFCLLYLLIISTRVSDHKPFIFILVSFLIC